MNFFHLKEQKAKCSLTIHKALCKEFQISWRRLSLLLAHRTVLSVQQKVHFPVT